MAVDEMGNTPLHLAAMGAKVDILRQLVDQGADVQAINNGFETPLHVAARSRSTQTLHALVKKGASVWFCSLPCLPKQGMYQPMLQSCDCEDMMNIDLMLLLCLQDHA